MDTLRVFEGFAGVGAVSKSLERLNIPHELVGFSEIDKYGVKSFSVIHNVSENLNYGDVCLIDETKLPDFDLYTFGSPCQDFSVAGKQKGATWICQDCGHEYNPLDVYYSKRSECPNCGGEQINKTRSSLVVEALRIIRHKKPKYLLMENVKNLVGKQFKPSFDKIIAELQEYGYSTYWDVLNAKDYGIPQNRERVFVVSVRKDIDKKSYKFPIGFESNLRLKDLLEDKVEEKYYLNKKDLNIIYKNENHNPSIITGVYNQKDGFKEREFANTLDASYYKGLGNNQDRNAVSIRVKNATKQGYLVAELGDSINIQFPDSKTRRGRVQKGVAGTLETACNQATLTEDFRIRKLTPLECFRLMGFDDEDLQKCRDIGISDTQLYKQAGNSIVVNVLEHIFKELFKEYM